ncbi:MAG: AAA family ATPase [Planctomycetaceae bacterium]
MLLQQLTLQNLLSFGDTPCVVPLRPLNVLIGPNGSGKSNFIEAIALLQAAPKRLFEPMTDGINEWLWKGRRPVIARIEAHMAESPILGSVRHTLGFTTVGSTAEIVEERIARQQPNGQESLAYQYGLFSSTKPMLCVEGEERELSREDLDFTKSILAQRKDPDQYREITFLAEDYEKIQLYRDWTFGRESKPRQWQRTDQRNDCLGSDFSNLGMMLNRIRRVSETKRQLLESLNELYPNIDDFDVSVEGGSVQVFFQEGTFTVPATRLSDGTLRYLCLLVILLQPSPPPLVCIEEPELGLHPDVLPGLADLLREASGRMQLIVTTHSHVLVDALSDTPESVIVCEKQEGQTTMERLDRGSLSIWLEQYTLGDLWRSGELGGNRW